MYLIAGLGNPGEHYKHSRHNIGFLMIDQLVKLAKIEQNFQNKFKALFIKDKDKIYIKPQTYMNKSGQAVMMTKDYYDIEPANIVVIHDDIDLAFGAIRLKVGGGHGGHNGLRSIDERIGADYMRVRIGVGETSKAENTSAFVLCNFPDSQINEFDDIARHIHECLNYWFETNDIDKTKSLYTKKVAVL